MAAINDVYQVIDTQMVNGQQALNVYFYRVQSTTLGANASDVVTAFIEQILPSIVAFQQSEVVHTSVAAKNLYDETDAHEELISTAGSVATGDMMTNFVAYPFRMVGDNAAVRSGSKRYAGVGETGTTDGVVTDATLLGLLDDMADALALVVNYGLLSAGELIPVIMARILVSQGVYRLPANQGEATFSNIVDALFSPLVSSQTSRKIGVGA
jgi:hypothetical protein